MSDILQSAANSLAEQTRKFDIAAYYTNGDPEKAKQMIAGSYKDLYVIKGRFSSSSVYGIFIFFFNSITYSVGSAFVLITRSFAVEDIKTSTDWKNFEKSMVELRDKNEHDQVLSNHARDEMVSGMGLEFCRDIKKLFDNNDAIAANHRFKKLVESRLSFQQAKMTIDVEQISSLDMELYSQSSKKIDAKKLQDAQKKDAEESAGKTEAADRNDPLAGKEVKLILNGSMILSPIKGKDISSLVAGDRVRIKIVDRNPKGIQVAKAFNAYDEETREMQPIIGRVVSIKRDSKAGYEFFIIVAKGIFVKVIEEEDNIKVAVEDPEGGGGQSSAADPTGSRISAPLITLLVVVFLVMLGVVIFLVL
jgi:hypothetical protein